MGLLGLAEEAPGITHPFLVSHSPWQPAEPSLGSLEHDQLCLPQYLGAACTLFALHVEDICLHSISYLMSGHTKLW